MLIIGYTHRLQIELNPDFVLSNRACNRKTEKNINLVHMIKIMLNTFISKILK